MSLCRIKNHHSSFRNLKLKRLIWQRSVYCENECHNKIVLFIHTGRNITINMDIIEMCFFIIILTLAAQHSHTWQPFPVHYYIVIVEHFSIKINAEYSAWRREDLAWAKHLISKWRTRKCRGQQTNMAKSNLNEEAAIIILMSSF